MLWLVRHGESEANAGVVTSDPSTIALTARGWSQAEAVAAACDVEPAWMGLSPYLRARQTAEPLLARYPDAARVELSVQEFTYLAADRCVGMNAATRQPLVDAYWERLDPEFCDGEGAESFTALWGRAVAFLEFAAEQPDLGVVFTHEQFIRAVLMAVWSPGADVTAARMGQFFALRSALPVPNGAVIRLKRDQGRWWLGGVDTRHLAGL